MVSTRIFLDRISISPALFVLFVDCWNSLLLFGDERMVPFDLRHTRRRYWRENARLDDVESDHCRANKEFLFRLVCIIIFLLLLRAAERLAYAGTN